MREGGEDDVFLVRIDFNGVDERGNNALHVAVKEGHIKTARVLLTESRISAEAANTKGRSPLHELARSVVFLG